MQIVFKYCSFSEMLEQAEREFIQSFQNKMLLKTTTDTLEWWTDQWNDQYGHLESQHGQ